jgi:hypothetical protein
VLIPSTEELSKALFLSSFATTFAINLAFWVTLSTIGSYYALFIMGLNILLTAPITLSIASLSNERWDLKSGFTICYSIFAAIKIASFAICLSKVAFYEGGSIASLRNVCKNYYVAMILLIASSIFQFILLWLVTTMIYLRVRNLGTHNPQNATDQGGIISSQTIRMVGLLPYTFAILSIIILERLDTYAQLTSDNPENGYNSLSFSQIFAVATTIAPVIEFIKYMFHKQPRLNDRSPFWHIIRATNFHRRKYSHST